MGGKRPSDVSGFDQAAKGEPLLALPPAGIAFHPPEHIAV